MRKGEKSGNRQRKEERPKTKRPADRGVYCGDKCASNIFPGYNNKYKKNNR